MDNCLITFWTSKCAFLIEQLLIKTRARITLNDARRVGGGPVFPFSLSKGAEWVKKCVAESESVHIFLLKVVLHGIYFASIDIQSCRIYTFTIVVTTKAKVMLCQTCV